MSELKNDQDNNEIEPQNTRSHQEPKDIFQILRDGRENAYALFLRNGHYFGIQDLLAIFADLLLFAGSLRSCISPWMVLISLAEIALCVGLKWKAGADNCQKRNYRSLRIAFIAQVIITFVFQLVFALAGSGSELMMVSALRFITSVILLFNAPIYLINWKWDLLKAICVALWGYLAAMILHSLYLTNGMIKGGVDAVFSFIFPINHVAIRNSGWIGNGFTFFLGCMAIINWSKERPCKTWNPYTAQELRIIENILGTAIILLCGLAYAHGNGANRAAFILVVCLLTTDLYALFLCNSQKIHGFVRRRIIQKINPFTLASRIRLQESVGINKMNRDISRRREYKRVSDDIVNFSKQISLIAHTVMTSEQSLETKVENIKDLAIDVHQCIKCVDKQGDNVVSTIGFIFGFSICPGRLADKEKEKDVAAFVRKLSSEFMRYEESFYRMIALGVQFSWIRADDLRNSPTEDSLDIGPEDSLDIGPSALDGQNDLIREFIIWASGRAGICMVDDIKEIESEIVAEDEEKTDPAHAAGNQTKEQENKKKLEESKKKMSIEDQVRMEISSMLKPGFIPKWEWFDMLLDG